MLQLGILRKILGLQVEVQKVKDLKEKRRIRR